MKKIWTVMILILTAIMCLSLAACGSADDIMEPAAAPEMKQFVGVIDSIDGDEAIVTPDEGEDIRSSGDAVFVCIADYSKPLKVGDVVTVYFDGTIMESYPLQINVLGINDEMFEIEVPADCENPDAADAQD